MEYDELYDESPYASKEVLRQGGMMTTIRATFLVCATILASVFAIIFYGYQQDQYVVTSMGNFVSIFDRKTRSLNICDKGNCTLVTPMLEGSRPPMIPGMGPQASPASQRVIGTYPQPQGPQMARPVQPAVAQPQPAAANPQAAQAQQMLQQLTQMEMMAQQLNSQPMSPQRMQFIQQRRAMEDQALAANMLNPQMVQQVRQQREIEDQQLAQAQKGAQTTGGAGATPTAANTDATPAAATEDAGGDDAKADDGGKKDDTAASDETEEAAPV